MGCRGHVLANGQCTRRQLTFDTIWFRGLFEDHYRDLLAYALRRVRSTEDARDVVADVFVVAWRRRATIPDDPTEQRMWLYGVARRTLSNRHRSETRRDRLTARLVALDAGVVPDPLSDDDLSDLATAFEVLDALNPNDKEILLLSVWEDLTVSQIATVLGISAANVSLRLHRAKTRLRREFLRQVKDHGAGGHVVDRRAHGDVAPETSP